MTTLTLDSLATTETPRGIRRARAYRFNALLSATDAVVMSVAVDASTHAAPGMSPLSEEARVALTVVAFSLLAFLLRSYTWRTLTHPMTALPRLGAAAAAACLWTWASGLHSAHPLAFTCAAGAAAAMLGSRMFARSLLRHSFSAGAGFRRALVVDMGGAGRAASELQSRSGNGIRVVATTGADVDAAIAVARRERVDLVAIEAPWERMRDALDAAERMRVLPADIAVIPDSLDDPRLAFGLGAACAEPARRSYGHMVAGWGAAAKRIEDVVVSGTILFLASPVMAAAAIAIKLESPGPVIFRQRRMGFNEETFEVWKFRSMRNDLADAGGGRQTGRGDPRVTRVGRFIRRTSIDELPQLANVLLGSMSVVGPRPHPTEMRALGQRLEVAAPGYPLRHRVKPGLTGWAQVNGCRGEIDSVEKLVRRVDLDVEYIERWSVGFDLWIIAKTALKVISDKTAY